MHLLCIILVELFYFTDVDGVQIDNNGYKDISIAFSDTVELSTMDFQKLKTVLQNASEILFQATRKRSYFHEFILVVPAMWVDNDGICDEEYTAVAPKKVDIYISRSTSLPNLKTQHSKGCGKEGDVIYMQPDWLQGEILVLALEFVRHWSTFRYGVFSENPEKSGTCFATSDNTWSPTGCYNVKLDVEATFDEDGLPVCYLPENVKGDFHSSIMFSANSSKAVNFCDGSDLFPHNPVAATFHNRICGGKSSWSVIKNTDDFKYGRNLPIKDAKPPNNPSFRCFRESKTQVTLAVQNSSPNILPEALIDIRYALYHFLSTMVSSDFSVNLVTFSDNTTSGSVSLDVTNRTKLRVDLEAHVKQKSYLDACLRCGLEKAYETIKISKYSPKVVVLLSWESSLERSKITDLIDIIQNNRQIVLYLLLIENEDNNIVPQELADTIQSYGGRIFRLKADAVPMVTQLNIALLDAFKNVLHIEDELLLVHEKLYENVTSNFTDTFLTPKINKGRLLYTMHCYTRGSIQNVFDTCSDWDTHSNTYKCGREVDINNSEFSIALWKHHYKRLDNVSPIKCSAMALLKIESSSNAFFTVRGWFSENKIVPGYNALIIYAEVIGRRTEAIQVEAVISGPGLENFILELRDNGNGDPDIAKGDDIYSRYFTSFTQKGSYTVKIRAIDQVMDENFAPIQGEQDYNESTLTQIRVIGTFSVIETVPQEDILPPNQITDLTVVSINNQNGTIWLQWTAPGNDYDYGKANQYIFKLSNCWTSLLDLTFNAKDNILLTILDEELPANSGFLQKIRFRYPLNNYNTIYYIAAQAVDAEGNEAKVSNIIQIYFRDSLITEIDLITSDETWNNNKTTLSLEFTNTVNSAKVKESTTTVNANVTDIPINIIDEICLPKKTIIIIFSTTGSFLIIFIIINIIVCYCCFIIKKKKSEKKNTLPNISYKYESESSLDHEEVAASSSTLAGPTSSYSNLQDTTALTNHKYTFHTKRSLTDNENKRCDKNKLGFEVVQTTPAYATSSLFASQQKQSNHQKSVKLQPGQLQILKDTQIYSLGRV